jgi:hypothetical protein
MGPRTSEPTLSTDSRNGHAPRTAGPSRFCAYVDVRFRATEGTPVHRRPLLVHVAHSLTGRVRFVHATSGSASFRLYCPVYDFKDLFSTLFAKNMSLGIAHRYSTVTLFARFRG